MLAVRIGLTPLQLDLLQTIAEGRPPQPVTGQLAIELGVSQPTITDALAALERKGHLQRQRDTADARRTTMQVTDAGRAAVDEARQQQTSLRATLERMPADEQDTALESLLDLIGSLLDVGVVQVARTCPTCRFFSPAQDAAAQCALLGIPLERGDLRVNCAEHEPARA